MPIALGEVSLILEGAGGMKFVPQVTEETQLIRNAQKGDIRAFNELVRAHQSRVYKVACRILEDPQAAADATQEAFISAYRHIGALRSGSLLAWLMRIVTNACYDQLRKRQGRRADSLDEMQADPEKANPHLVESDQMSPQEHVERRELNDLIQQGLATLPFEQRTTLILADIEQYTYEQVGEMTQTNIGTVKSRLARGRGALRKFLLAEESSLPLRYRRARGSTPFARSGSPEGLGPDRIIKGSPPPHNV